MDSFKEIKQINRFDLFLVDSNKNSEKKSISKKPLTKKHQRHLSNNLDVNKNASKLKNNLSNEKKRKK